MSSPETPRLFLERSRYQRRRLIDALRMLPFLGALVWLVPLIWARAIDAPISGAEPVSVVSASIYVFVVWAVLIVLSAALAARDPGAEHAQPAADTDL